ncbi:flagellin domain protein [Dethiosulfovibrio peptidovorans DSM 11002]|uniref:Flagellin domain protein n=1 Tax=Dethiosulfovibrio peptidovorans DSM 11002 TaxID=469381 RepID=D2Z961_9BACT|nr:flagellar hook-associated protein FlgL [Dethiosulfovibrio peptidovorans]EFC92008.1 flagellin domain protein [Dethiosulfovibrio peptidovorans DSM 11002]
MRRVSNSMMYGGMMTDMHNNLARLLKMNKQGSTGKLHHKPSDSPIDVTRELSLSTTIYENEQYIRNMNDGLTWLKNTDSALNQIGEMIDRVRSLSVRAGSGALNDEEMDAIAQEMIELQEGIREAANYSVEGRYLLSGAATSVPAFQRDEEGHVIYAGNDYRVQFEMERGIVSDVSVTGKEVFPDDYTQYTLRSADVPADFEWTGRNEIIQIQVGDRSVKIRIPEEDWEDDNYDSSTLTDYNRFRDPGELHPMSLDDIAETIESSVNMGDAGKLVSVQVIKDEDAGTQKLEIRSHTGEPISMTSWPETDDIPMNQAVESLAVDDSVPGGYVLPSDGSIEIAIDDSQNITTLNFTAGMTLDQMADQISGQEGLVGKVINSGTSSAKLIVVSSDENVKLNVTPEGGATNLFGPDPVASEAVSKPHDHSHIGLMGLLGMETSLQGTEYSEGATIASGLSDTNKVNFYIQSGKNKAEILVNSGPDMTLEDLAQEIRAVAGDWLEVVVQTDPGDGVAGPNVSGSNLENGTQRLVIRAKDAGAPVSMMDLATDGTNANTSLIQSMGLSTAVYAQGAAEFPTGGDLDPNMPARMTVSVGERDYDLKLYSDDVATGGVVDNVKMAREIQRQVGKGPDGEDLIGYKELSSGGVALFATSGEPLQFVDRSFGDPSVDEYSAGLALQSGIASGIQGESVAENLAVDTGSGGVMRIEALGRSVDISVAPGDTMKDFSEKLRKYAGNWLNVSYVDTDLDDGTNDVRLSISAKDGSAVNVYDLEPAAMTAGGPGAAAAFGIDTAIRGAALPAGPVVVDDSTNTLSISVDGYEHTMDLRELDADGSGVLSHDEMTSVVDLINSRFQGQDVEAQLYTDQAGDDHVILTSPKGYEITVSGDLANDFFGAATITSPDHGGTGPYGQVVTRRTGADYRQTDFFGMMEDLIDAVKGQDSEAITTLLGDIDNEIDSLLKCRTEEGALVKRYEGSSSRLTQNNGNYTELYSSISDTDLAKMAMEYMSAQSVYQAGLATIARIIQPTLVDFLS